MDFKYSSHVTDPEDEFLLRRIYDLITITERKKQSTTTDFLNPYQCKLATDLISRFPDIDYSVSGGYPDAERRIIRIFPDFRSEDADDELTFFEIPGIEGIRHPDVLGSILSLGIERKKIGDIIVSDNCVQWIVKREIGDFIEFQLRKIKNNYVRPVPITSERLEIPKPLFREKIATVSSLRLDSIISGAFNLSRGNARQLIKEEQVRVNFKKETKPALFLEEGSLISVRRKGRVYFKQTTGRTRKDKYRILLAFPES